MAEKLTDNKNIFLTTESERLAVTPHTQHLYKDADAGFLFYGDGSTVGGTSVDVRPATTKTANYTLLRKDEGRLIVFNSGSGLTLTIPTNANVPFVNNLTEIHVLNIGAGAVTLSGASGVTVSGTTSLAQYAKATIRKTGTDAWVVLASVAASGDIEGVTAGTGLGGGGTSGTVTLTNTGVTSIVAGTNISISGATGAVTITGTDTNTQLTTEQVQDIVGDMLVGTETRIGVSYDDTNGRINFIVDDMTANTQLTTEEVQDIIGAMIAGNTESGITVTYDDTNGKLDLSVASQTENSFTTTLKNKLDAIEASATADQTAAEIRVLVEAATDSNVFTDADHSKLGGIATSANNYAISSDLLDEDNMTSNSATKVASQQSIKTYVDAEVAGVVNSAPAALNTLNELAAALGDDANYASTTSTALGNRLRTDTDSQGLSATQQGNALTNLGITATKAEINILDDGLSASDIPSLAASKITSGTFATARIADAAITAGKLNVTGDGSATQFLRSDGDGSFTWAVPTDTNTDTNTQLTQEQVEDFVAGVITAGTNVSVTYDDSAGTLTIASTDTNTQLSTESVQDIVGAMLVGTETRIGVTYDDTNGRINFVVDDMTANDNTQLSTEQVQDIVGAMFTSNTETRITATYQDGDGTIDLVVDDQSSDNNTTYSISAVDGDNTDEEKIRLTDNAGGTDDVVLEAGTGLTIARSGDKITFTNSITDTNTQLTTEQVQDIIGSMVDGGTETNISVTYDDTNGKINFVSTDTNTTYSVGDGGLTQNNFTNTLKTKLDGIATSANNYAISSDLLDEDNMASNSASKVASQQSIKAYVDAEVATNASAITAITTGAPSLLNTLDELAAALGDDANFATTTATSLGQKLVKTSNLSDLANAGTARSNLGLGTASTLSGTGAIANGNAGLVTGDVVFDYIAAQGFGSGSGDITAVVAGTGLSGGATSGSATVNIDSTVATLTGSQTLTNKSLTSPTLTGTVTATATINVSGNNKLGISDGGASAPTLRFVDDTDTGIYRPASGQIGFTSNGTAQVILKDGSLEPVTDNDVDLGTSSLKFKNSYFGLVDAENFKVNGGQGSDGQILTSTGSGVAWENAAGGSVGGSDTELLYNNGGTEDGIASLTWTDTAGSEQFKITDTSDTALVLIEQLGTGNALEIHDVASDTSIFKVMANGNIGVGLPSGTGFGGAKLYVSGAIHATSNFKAEQSMGVSTPGFNFNGDNNTGMGQFQGADSLGFVTGGTERLTIGSAGQLGIAGANYGTDGQVLTSTGASSAPAWEDAGSGGASTIGALDDVLMDATNFVDSLLIQTDSNGSAPTTGTLSSATGNLGIGKDIFEDLTSGTYNVGIGYEVMKQLTNASYHVGIGYKAMSNIGQTGGGGSVAIGKNAMLNATSGSSQIAIGEDAMGAGGTNGGSQNIAIGWEAGKVINNADYNTFIGSRAGKSNTSGSRNIAIGVNSYDAADTENDNIAIGYDALGGSVAGGEKNVSIGNYSGDALTSGDYNVFVGHKAGTGVTTGQANVIVGNQEYTSSTMTGSYNVHIGQRAGEDTTDGTYNTLVGASSGSNVSSGDYNTTLGVDALFRADTQHGNVALGYKAGYQAKGNYNISIGYLSGQQSGTSGTGTNNILLGVSAGDNITNGSNNVMIGGADAASATDDDQLSISSGDGGTTWITGNSSGAVSFPNNQAGNAVAAASTANNAYLTLLEVPHGTYKAIKATVHITDSTNNEVQTMDVMAHYDGSAANFTEYGIIFDGAAAIGSVEADVNGSNLRLRFKNEQGGTATLAASIHAVLLA